MRWLQSTPDVSLKHYSTCGFILIGWVRQGYSNIWLPRAWWYNEALPHICTLSGVCGQDSAMLDLVSSTPSKKKKMKKAHQSQFPKYGDVYHPALLLWWELVTQPQLNCKGSVKSRGTRGNLENIVSSCCGCPAKWALWKFWVLSTISCFSNYLQMSWVVTGIMSLCPVVFTTLIGLRESNVYRFFFSV